MPVLTWLTKTFVAGVLQAGDLNQFRDNMAILENHRHTGVAGDGNSVLTPPSDLGICDAVQLFMRFPKSSTGFSFEINSSAVTFNYAISTSQNDEFVFPVGLRAGTWRLTTLNWKNTNYGIGTFYLDATSIGTIDFYNGGGSLQGQNGVISSIAVASSGWYDLKMKMATKNAGSSGYVAAIEVIELLRTGP